MSFNVSIQGFKHSQQHLGMTCFILSTYIRYLNCFICILLLSDRRFFTV